MGKSLGVFDSGFGGLTVLRPLLGNGQFDRFVYFGDTDRVPYGTRDADTIREFALADTRFLLSQGVDALVIACNTITAVALDAIREASGLPVYGVIAPAAAAAAKATKNGRIGLVATAATVRSGVYERAVHEIDPAAVMTQVPCPLFVNLVEYGFTAPGDPVTAAAAEHYLAPIREAGCDTVVMGCTHFPVIESAIRKELGEDVTLIDCGVELSKTIGSEPRGAAPAVELFVSGDPAPFDTQRRRFLPELGALPAQKIDITKY